MACFAYLVAEVSRKPVTQEWANIINGPQVGLIIGQLPGCLRSQNQNRTLTSWRISIDTYSSFITPMFRAWLHTGPSKIPSVSTDLKHWSPGLQDQSAHDKSSLPTIWPNYSNCTMTSMRISPTTMWASTSGAFRDRKPTGPGICTQKRNITDFPLKTQNQPSWNLCESVAYRSGLQIGVHQSAEVKGHSRLSSVSNIFHRNYLPQVSNIWTINKRN